MSDDEGDREFGLVDFRGFGRGKLCQPIGQQSV